MRVPMEFPDGLDKSETLKRCARMGLTYTVAAMRCEMLGDYLCEIMPKMIERYRADTLETHEGVEENEEQQTTELHKKLPAIPPTLQAHKEA